MNQVLVIGYGNPLRADDGFGWHVAQCLMDLKLEHLEVIACHQLMPELADALERVDHVIFVDASLKLEAAKLEHRRLEPLATSEVFTHHLEPAVLLALTQKLCGHVPNASLISVGVSSLAYNEQLSAEIAALVPLVVAEIQDVCDKTVIAW